MDWLRKMSSYPVTFAMLVESSVVAPFVLIYLLFFSKETLLDYSLLENVLLLASGIVTAIPLLLFAEAVNVRR